MALAVGIGADQQFLIIGVLGIGGPHLGPRDHNVIAIDHAACLERGKIGTGVGFGKTLTPECIAA